MQLRLPTFALTAVALSALAAPAFAAKPTGKGPCKDAEQCRGGVCVEVNGDAYCSKTCGDCPAGMYCDARLFSMVGMKVCLRGRASAPVEPKAPPRLPCKTDDQCQGALVCAQMMGHKDCTLPCTSNKQCEAPEVMGVKMDFLSCQLDEGKRGRKACLPKRSCIANPAQCMSFDAKPTADLMQGMMGMAQGMADAVEPPAADPAPDVATPAPEPTNRAMSEARFARLLGQVKEASFDDERSALLRTAAKRNWFSCAQLSRVVEVLAFGDERVGAVKVMAPRLVDKENSHEVLAKFTFDDERNAAEQILNAN